MLICVACQISFGQTNVAKMVHGKIKVDAADSSGINILNTITNKSAVTNSDGEFDIIVRVKDVLIFTAVHLETTKRTIKEEDFILDVLNIEMKANATMLKAVVIKAEVINAVSAGILIKEAKKYTVAERRLQTAGDFKPIMLLNLLGGGMQLDPLINKINGRTKRLKKLVVLEKKDRSIKMISELYAQDYFLNQLKIPAEYVSGFKYYLVENGSFLKVLESKDEDKISFHMISLAQEYNGLLKSEDYTNLKR